jgi:hypothetical protein
MCIIFLLATPAAAGLYTVCNSLCHGQVMAGLRQGINPGDIKETSRRV